MAAGVGAGAWGLVLAVLSAALHAFGWSSLGALLPRRPAWSLVVRPCGPESRTIHAAILDRSRPAPRLPRVALGALLAGLAALGAGPGGAALGAGLLTVVAAIAAILARPAEPEAGGPEVRAAEALLSRAAGTDDPAVGVVLCGGASEAGEGVAAVLDWRAVRPERAEIALSGDPEAVARAATALARAGWRVHSALPPSPRSPA